MDSSTKECFDQLLKAVALRMWRVRCASILTYAGYSAAIGWLILAMIRNVVPFPHWQSALVLAAVGLAWLAWRAFTEFQSLKNPLLAARQIDRRACLENRVTTAVELADQPAEAVAELVREDAAISAQRIRPEDVVSMPAPRSILLSMTAILVSGLALWGSPFIVPVIAIEQQPMKTVVADDNNDALLTTLEQVVESLKEAESKNASADLQALVQSAEETVAKLKEGELSVAEAYLQLSRLQQEMLAAAQPLDKESAWQEISDALQSSRSTDSIGKLLQAKQFEKAGSEMAQLDPSLLSSEKMTPAEVRSLSEKLTAAADEALRGSDTELANILNDLSAAVKDGNSDSATQQMQGLAAESAKYKIELEQAEHLDAMAEQLSLSKQQLAIKSNSSGDGQMGGQGLNEETGKSKGKGGADSQKAGAKTAGNVNGPKANLEGQRKLAELQGQFGEEGTVEVKTKSTDERPDFEVTRKAQSVHAEYSRQLEADLRTREVPAGHQEIVRNYFEAIRPKTDSAR